MTKCFKYTETYTQPIIID